MSNSSIIVIDDDKNNSQQISEILRQEGYTVYSATTKAESVAQVRKDPPGLVFVKSMLMDASGYEIIRDIRSTHPDIPFIMLTEIDKRYDDRYKTIYKIVNTVRIPVDREDLLEKTRTNIIDANDLLNETAPYDADRNDVVPEKKPQPQPPKYVQEQEEEEVQSQGYDSMQHEDKGRMFELEEVAYQNEQGPEDFEHDTEVFDSVPADYAHEDEDNLSLNTLRQKRDRFDFEDEIKRQNKQYTEDITTVEYDEEEFIRSLKEKNAKRKKVIAGIAGLVFLVLVAGVYMFVVRDGSAKNKKPIIAQNTKPPVARPTPLPVVVATPPAVKPTPAVVSHVTPEPTKPQRIMPEYVAPEEVKPPANVIAANGQEKPGEKPAQKPPETVQHPVGKTPKSKEKAVVTKEPKAQVKVAKGPRQLKPKQVPEEPVEEAYTIQLGSFADPANAHRLKESLKKDGYSAFVKEFPAQPGQDIAMHKVFVGRYKTKADAMKTVKKLRDTKNMGLILKKM
ncbi:protein containing Sporulation/cell division region, bacteria [Candidatus Magnetobacterium bavaricum]|uniref:Protein containing Sporulation/cell division region, bacteria n=1 Tax=Candidatus Magnetobacterium bavaricum TaxID=29290 RepID=A0A0F3GT04_9BACT|nr:protein containing Sporulation/cell division region, bacteria [Candidatus Magnetobacterium bavaricum]